MCLITLMGGKAIGNEADGIVEVITGTLLYLFGRQQRSKVIKFGIKQLIS